MDRINRKEFITRSLKAGIAVAVTGLIGYKAYDSKGPSAQMDKAGLLQIPDYSIAAMKGKLAIVKGENRADTITKGLQSLGGIDQFIKKGDRVLIKVNAAFALPQELSATTHPEVIKQVALLCFKAGAAEVRVTDNPINDPASCFKISGIEEVCQSNGIKLIYPKEDYFKSYTLDKGLLIQDWPVLLKPLDSINKVIGIAPLKDHHRSGASMTMKNWYGLLGGRRNIFHQDVHNLIKELSMMMKPTLVILDGTTAMMTNGPTGGSLADLKKTNMMIIGTDQVAVDSFGATLLDRNASQIPFLGKAASAGSGTTDYQSLKPIII